MAEGRWRSRALPRGGHRLRVDENVQLWLANNENAGHTESLPCAAACAAAAGRGLAVWFRGFLFRQIGHNWECKYGALFSSTPVPLPSCTRSASRKRQLRRERWHHTPPLPATGWPPRSHGGFRPLPVNTQPSFLEASTRSARQVHSETRAWRSGPFTSRSQRARAHRVTPNLASASPLPSAAHETPPSVPGPRGW